MGVKSYQGRNEQGQGHIAARFVALKQKSARLNQTVVQGKTLMLGCRKNSAPAPWEKETEMETGFREQPQGASKMGKNLEGDLRLSRRQ